MPYISKINLDCGREHPFPFDIQAVKHAKYLDFFAPITFMIGDNGSGKSTLLETVAFKLQLPNMDGSSYDKRGFEAARALVPYLEIIRGIDMPKGFFFRAEDFGNLLNSIERGDNKLSTFFDDMKGEIPNDVLERMRENANYQTHYMRKNYGQDLQSFSHGEAYFKIMNIRLIKQAFIC